MSTHTPGPWSYDADRMVSAVGGLICDPHADREIDPPEIEANARLIAAAPDMFEVLTFILEEFSDNGEFNHHTAEHGICDLLALAKAAVRKAKRGVGGAA